MKPGSYTIDPSRSKISFRVTNLLVIPVTGQFTRFQGRVTLASRFEESTADAKIEISSIDTDWKGRDDHLRNEDFFDVKRFPYMEFRSSAIKGESGGFVLTGTLDLHGVRREVGLDARFLPDGTIEAKGSLNRRDFGLTAGPSIKNKVELELRIVLNAVG
jgi:polyisoprenoid-binding protein YceI